MSKDMTKPKPGTNCLPLGTSSDFGSADALFSLCVGVDITSVFCSVLGTSICVSGVLWTGVSVTIGDD